MLSEPEEDEEGEPILEEQGEARDQCPSHAVEKAVVQLTKLVSSLAKEKKNSRGLEGILIDGSSGDPTSSSSGGRSKAAAYQRLKAALTEKPELLFQSMEEKMEEDFNGGCVWAHKKGMQIQDRCWRMRLQHTKTLGFYLQETTAGSILPSLSVECRYNIQALRALLPILFECSG